MNRLHLSCGESFFLFCVKCFFRLRKPTNLHYHRVFPESSRKTLPKASQKHASTMISVLGSGRNGSRFANWYCNLRNMLLSGVLLAFEGLFQVEIFYRWIAKFLWKLQLTITIGKIRQKNGETTNDSRFSTFIRQVAFCFTMPLKYFPWQVEQQSRKIEYKFLWVFCKYGNAEIVKKLQF